MKTSGELASTAFAHALPTQSLPFHATSPGGQTQRYPSFATELSRHKKLQPRPSHGFSAVRGTVQEFIKLNETFCVYSYKVTKCRVAKSEPQILLVPRLMLK